MSEATFRPSTGGFFQTLEKDCNGTLIIASDVSSLKYSIYEIGYGGTRTPVTGHTNVSCSLSCITSVKTDPETGKQYNIKIPISAQTNLPFPNIGSTYEIEVIMCDTSGEPHAEYLQGVCGTTG